MVFTLNGAVGAISGALQPIQRKSTVKRLHFLAITAFSSLSLAACAGSGSSPLNTGERISQRGSQIGQYGDMWSAGQDDVVRGERTIARSSEAIERAQSQIAETSEALEKAEDRLREAQQDKEDAEQLVADGIEQMDRAEQNYEALRTGPSAGISPRGETQDN